jgi:integrating conjugative element protein (TIGR03765 family)
MAKVFQYLNTHKSIFAPFTVLLLYANTGFASESQVMFFNLNEVSQTQAQKLALQKIPTLKPKAPLIDEHAAQKAIYQGSVNDLELPSFSKQQLNHMTQQMINQRYHLQTKSMSLGKVESYQKTFKQIGTPLAFVGCDAVSHRWLVHYAQKLKSISTLVMVVNCDNEKSYQTLSDGVPLALLTSNADVYSQSLGVHHYPVLVTAQGVFQ